MRGVTEALSISYEKLSRPTRFAARLLAQLAPVPIPMAAVDEMDGVLTLEVRRQLIGRSFVVRQDAPSTSPDVFGSMHRIIADFLRTKDGDSKEIWGWPAT
ncbi:MAG TPA: hypothetical protein VFU03_06820 [Gemmatimonadales bacterium]|nr:hypothetical protein [Gemmatimonadales bacterium]